MRLAVITLGVGPDGAFEDQQLRDFCSTHDVVTFSEHRFVWQGEPRWSFMLQWRPLSGSTSVRLELQQRVAEQQELKAELTQEERALFERLREWRNATMKASGRPSFVMFSNRQLVDLVRTRHETLSGLREIQGIGEQKAEQFGVALLELLRSPVLEEMS